MARKSRKMDFVPAGQVQEAVPEISTTPLYRAGLYARLSFESEKNRERNTIETQMELLNRFVQESPDIVVEKQYFDISQTGTNFERSGFDEMMQDIRNGRINCVVVKDLSRLGRNYLEAGNYIERVFPFFEVRFIAVNDGYDSEKAEAGLLVPMSNIFNEYYSRDLAKKVRASHRSGWEKGKCMAGSVVYGLMRDPDHKGEIIHDPETVGNVVRMFDMFLEGKTYAEIARIFNSEGLLNPKAYKYWKKNGALPENFSWKWTGGSVIKLIGNRYYAGDSLHGQFDHDSFREKKIIAQPKEKWVIVENTHEPAVPREVFEKAQMEAERRRQENKQAKNPGMYSVADKNLFKKKIFCADCGNTMYLHRTSDTAQHFSCGGRSLKKICTPHTIDSALVYEQVMKVIHTHMNVYISSVDMMRRMNSRQENLQKFDLFGKEIAKCHRELAKLNKRKEQLYEDYVSHYIDAEQYEEFKEQDSRREKELQARMEEVSRYRSGYDANFKTDQEWAAAIEKYKNARKLTKKMVDAFLEKIEVHEGGSLTVHLYYDDMLEDLVRLTKEQEAEHGK